LQPGEQDRDLVVGGFDDLTDTDLEFVELTFQGSVARILTDDARG
jgi:hypothetical protein